MLIEHVLDVNQNSESKFYCLKIHNTSKIVSGESPCQEKNYVNQSYYDLNKYEFDYNNKEIVEYENLEFLQSLRAPKKEKLSKAQFSLKNYDYLDRNYGESYSFNSFIL